MRSWQWIASSLPADAVLSELEATASEAARAVPDPHLAAESPSLCRRTDPSAHQCPMRRVLAPFTYVSLHASCACWHWTRCPYRRAGAGGRPLAVPLPPGAPAARAALRRAVGERALLARSAHALLPRCARNHSSTRSTHVCAALHRTATQSTADSTRRSAQCLRPLPLVRLACAEIMADGLASAGFCDGVGATAQPLRRSAAPCASYVARRLHVVACHSS
jgi:hypothetical protein